MRYTRFSRLHRVSLFLTILLLFGCLPTVSHAKIVFSSKRNGDTLYHIYVMEDNGSNVRRITDPAFYDINPRWFPDGKQIMFQRDLTRGGGEYNSEFYIMDDQGFGEYNFMAHHPTDGYPVLSPDGKQIAFESTRAGEWDIYTYHLESGHLRQLTDNLDNREWSTRMDWSPDGNQIVYEHNGKDGDNIWTMKADGTKKKTAQSTSVELPYLSGGTEVVAVGRRYYV